MMLRPLKLSSFPHNYTFSRSLSSSAVSAASSAASPPHHPLKSPFPQTHHFQFLQFLQLHHQQFNQGIGFCQRRICSLPSGKRGSNSMGRNKDFSNSSPSFLPPKLPENRDKLPDNSSKLLTLPTILTIGRVAAVPFLVGSFYVESWWGPPATTCIFIAAAITDWLDGYLARRMKLGTAFGAFLDPVADKLMVAATLVLLCTSPTEAGIFGQAPWLLPVPAIAIIGREITMSAVREWAASQGSKLSEAVAVNNLGKWKTATQMIALTILLGTRGSSIIGTDALVTSGVLLLYFSAWLAVWSLFVYMRKIWKVLLM